MPPGRSRSSGHAPGVKGDAICPNARTVSEKQADAAVLQGLIEYVESGAFEAWLDEVVRADVSAHEP
jgi:hypothetical protein